MVLYIQCPHLFFFPFELTGKHCLFLTFGRAVSALVLIDSNRFKD